MLRVYPGEDEEEDEICPECGREHETCCCDTDYDAGDWCEACGEYLDDCICFLDGFCNKCCKDDQFCGCDDDSGHNEEDDE